MDALYVVVGLACLVAFIVAMGVWAREAADGRRLARIAVLVREDRVGEALAAPLPRRDFQEEALVMQATAALSRGDLGEADRLVEQAARGGALEAGTLLVARLVKARVLAEQGRHDELARFLGDDPQDPLLRDARAAAAIERGEADLAERLLGGPDPQEARQLRALATLRLRQERYAEADALLVTALERLGAMHDAEPSDEESATTTLRAAVALRSGDLDLADRLSTTALERVPPTGPTTWAHAELLLVAAETAARRGDLVTARAQLDAAAGALSGRDLPALQARLPMVEAEIAAAAGDVGLARTRLTEAVEAHELMGVVAEVGRLRRRLGELG